MKRILVLVLFWLASVGLSSIPVIAGPSTASRWMDVEGSDLPMFSAVQHGSEFWVVVRDGDFGQIMKWSGLTLEPVGPLLFQPEDMDLMSYHGEVYSGGLYVRDEETGDWWGWRIWTGSGWESAIDTTMWDIHSLGGYAVLRDTLYLVGLFRTRQTAEDFYLARVDGNNLIGIPTELSGIAADAATYQDQLFISVIGSHGSVQENFPRVYRFDGTTCAPVLGEDGQTPVGNAQTNSSGTNFLEYQGELYVSGLFKLSGATELTSIAKWDGSNWTDMNLNLPRDRWGGIGSMVEFQNKIISTYWASERGIWQFSNSTWSRIGELEGQAARQILVRDGQLLVIGEFTTVDNTEISYAATPNYCCIGTRGNVDGDAADQVDLSDLSSMVSFLVAGVMPPTDCSIESDVDGSLNVDLSDLSILIAYLTQTENRPVLSTCP
ncbi:MAG: hypothetical protein IPH75_11515 [bacterium]|nr:hypothetical protein [bacterium]